MVPGTRSMFLVVVLKLIWSPLSNQIVDGGLAWRKPFQDMVFGSTLAGSPELGLCGSGSGKMGRTT